MKKFIFFIPFVIFFVIASKGYSAQAYVNGNVCIYFSPKGGSAKAIINRINQAKKEIYVQAYCFTSYPIATALINAFKRGIKIIVILDKSELHDKWSKMNLFFKSGIPVYIAYRYNIFHDKIILIDDKEVITGSFNFTYSAEDKNAENLIIIPSKSVAEIYLKNFFFHLQGAEKLYRK